MKYCIYCGSSLPDAARFCTQCGKAMPEEAASQAQPEAPKKKDFPKAAASLLEGAVPAAAQAGELPAGAPFELGGGLLSGEPVLSEQAQAPIRAAFNTRGVFFKGVVEQFRQPRLLIPVLVLAALWVVLWFLRDSDSPIVKLLSFLSFANVGQSRGIVGTIGTALGKGAVAAFWASLFNGGIPALFKGLGGMIRGTGEKRGPVQLLIGAVLGAALYFACSGIAAASASTAMAGVAGAALAVESIGSKSSPLFGLARGLTSKLRNGLRVAQTGKAQSLLSGLSLGSVLAAAVMALIHG